MKHVTRTEENYYATRFITGGSASRCINFNILAIPYQISLVSVTPNKSFVLKCNIHLGYLLYIQSNK